MKIFFAIIILFFTSTAIASKTLTYKNYKIDTSNEDYIEHIKSLESGMSWLQVYNGFFDIEPRYCKPGKLNITIENLEDAIKLGVNDLQSKGTSNEDIDVAGVGILLLIGLEILFPCN
tara:strand:+ start:2572 stop:2925 length:354 start_codon:yes stop_codon:yes gene_type:complete